MNGRRFVTGVGIALGGTGGALAALIGSPEQPELIARARVVKETAPASTPAPAPASASPPASASAFAPTSAPAPASADAPVPLPEPAPTDVPTTRDALLKAQLYCDQRKAFDECTRAAHAFEIGSAGPADPEQAKRFRKIALTHLVTQCETGNSPHACFVLAAKYRAGKEVALNPTGAMALEKRALELCRFRPSSECSAP
ncbi:MAG TPA: hypothetical protein VJM31_06270 [Vicinamibacterales bacterium]|nr:hypothetical protein [Vicinamibacterales bacterium]